MRIVCFHLNQVGDLAFSLPALKCIRDTFPDATVTSVVRPAAREVLESTHLADEVVSREPGLNLDKYRLARRLAAARPDVAMVFSQSAECVMLSYISRAPKRIGFINTSFGRLLTDQVDFTHPPSTQNNLRLVESAGCDITKKDYVGLLTPSDAQIERANRILAEHSVAPGDPIATLAPGTSSRRSVKEWTDEGFTAVGSYLSDRGLKVVVLGTVPAASIINESGQIIDLSGKTDLGEVAAIVARSKLLVAVDSGILHLAAAAGTTVVGLYGPSNPEITGPQGDGHIVVTSNAQCSPCIRTECEHGRKCMLDITPDDVIQAIGSVLSRVGQARST